MNSINPYAPIETRSTIDRRSSVTWRSVCFVAIWILAIAMLLYSGTMPDGYRLYVMKEEAPTAYPWVGVLWVAGFMVGQATILYVVLRPESYAWTADRPFCAFAFQVLNLAFFSAVGLHAPPYYSFFELWMTVSSLVLLALLLIAAIVRLSRHGTANR